ncbi:MAG: hypothetical protein H6746_19795 [Deltaproteobacteria bacterium]|nr:hypothetical protein [Deltaproteobacteria bacterium]
MQARTRKGSRALWALTLWALASCGGGSGEADLGPDVEADAPGDVAADQDTSDAAEVRVDGGCDTVADCVDGLSPCQTATCEQGRCVVTSVDDDTACDDGDPCTAGELCTAGVCAGGSPVDCDDGELCTTDACGAEGCIHAPASGPCNDQDPCTVGDACDAAGACVGTPRNCAGLDGPCAVGDCDGATGQCVATTLPDDTACEDGDPCTVGELCTAGACVGTAVDCSSLDGPCVVGVCNPESGACNSEIQPNGKPCDDADPCTAGDRCVSGQCLPKGATLCSDGDPCNGVETCDSGQGGCQAGTPVVCDDGLPCNGVETCNPLTGQCQEGFASFCDDGNACNGVESCNPVTGSCIGGTPPTCDDGNPCNGMETCDGVLGCLKGKPDKCDDLNPCTLDTCDAVGGCQHALNPACACSTTADCAAKDTPGLCDGTLICLAGLCQVDPATVVSCDTSGDSDCERTVCNGATGLCEVDLQQGLGCSDGDPCTTQDVCVDGVCLGTPKSCGALDTACLVGVCQSSNGLCTTAPRNEGGSCADTNPCTTGETCQAGVCVGTLLDCSSLDGDCTKGKCDPTMGACVSIASHGGASCDTGDACEVGGKCAAGVCVGQPADCSAFGGPCTLASCDPVEGCKATPVDDGQKCSDGNACTVKDTCDGGVCSGAPADCSALDSDCLSGYCDAALGSCRTAPANDGAGCAAATPCGGVGVCDGGSCAATPVDCSGLDGACTVGMCDADTGSCVALPANEGAGCDDGRACTSGDVCSGGVCVGSGADCSAADTACGVGVCSDGGGCETLAAPAGLACDDGDPCTVGDACGAGGCAGQPKSCVASDACHEASCDPTTGACVEVSAHEGESCGAGNLCIEDGVCAAGVCVGDEPDCSALAPGPCEVAACDVGTGACTLAPLPDGSGCDPHDACAASGSCSDGVCVATPKDCSGFGDPDACVVGSCVAATGQCVGVPAVGGAACNDSDPCTVDDRCEAGTSACAGTPLECESLDGPCATGACDPLLGECVVVAAPDDEPCGSADTCGVLSCQGAECVSGALDCSDLDVPPCLAGQCDPASGLCQPAPVNEGANCDDGKACTTGEVCTGGLCKKGVAKDCSGGTSTCSLGYCDPNGGACKVAAINDSGPCDDLDPCTVGDTCQGGSCAPGAPVDCSNLGTACSGFTCDAATGQCTVPAVASDGSSCDDGLVCNGVDTCQAGECTAGTPPACAALNAVCVLGACDEGAGGCVEVVADGASCSPGEPCMAGTCDGSTCDAALVDGCDPADATLLCELSGAQDSVLSCEVAVVRSCAEVAPAASLAWTIAWDPTMARLLYYTDRDQDPAAGTPAYSYPAYAPDAIPGIDGYAPTATVSTTPGGPVTVYRHTVGVTPSTDFTAWEGTMSLAIDDAEAPADPIADGALDAGGGLMPGANILVMRAHFELLQAIAPSEPTPVHLEAISASGLDGVPLVPHLESGVILLDYPQSVCP